MDPARHPKRLSLGALPNFCTLSKQIHVDMEEASTPRVVEGVRQGLAALGVGWTAVNLSDLKTVPYRSDELCVVVPGDHPLVGLSKVSFEQLLSHELVGQPANSTLSILMRQLAAKAGVTLHHRIVVHSYEAALRVVEAGLAIGIVPRAVASPVFLSGSSKSPWMSRGQCVNS